MAKIEPLPDLKLTPQQKIELEELDEVIVSLRREVAKMKEAKIPEAEEREKALNDLVERRDKILIVYG